MKFLRKRAAIALGEQMSKEQGVEVQLWRVNYFPGEGSHFCFYFLPLVTGEVPPAVPRAIWECVKSFSPSPIEQQGFDL